MKFLKSKQTVFCTGKVTDDVVQAGSVILLGDAVLGEFVEKGGLPKIKADSLKGYFSQKPKPVSSLMKLMSPAENSFLHTYVLSKTYEKLIEMGVNASRIYCGFDSIIRYIRLKTFSKAGVIICASPYKADESGRVNTVLVEEFTFAKGELLNFREKRVAVEILTSEINRLTAEALRSFTADVSTSLFLCGPSKDLILNAIDPAYFASVIEPFNTTAGKPVQVSKGRSPAVLPYLAAIAVCAAISFGMIQYGKEQYLNAVGKYQASIAGYETVFLMGNGPIQLLELRKSYMDHIAEAKKETFKLPYILSAISSVKRDMPDIDLLAKEIRFNLHSYDNQDALNDLPDYSVTLQFNKVANLTPEQELKLWKGVFDSFSSKMPGVATSDTSPQTIRVSDGKEVLLMTISGKLGEA